MHEDVRLIHDARIEKDESHAGKVCERIWYTHNMHIFPASRYVAILWVMGTKADLGTDGRLISLIKSIA